MNRTLGRWQAAAALAAVLALAAPVAGAEPATLESVRALLALAGPAAGSESSERAIAQMRQRLPAVPEERWRQVAAELAKVDLTETLVPIYQKHLSQSDVEALLAFYATPAGKRVLAALPAIERDVLSAAEAVQRERAQAIAPLLATDRASN